VETELVTTPWGSLESFAGDLITDQLNECGAHQRSDLALLLSLLRSGDTAIDVGAHIGTYTIPIARAAQPVRSLPLSHWKSITPCSSATSSGTTSPIESNPSER
jgi:hypothetical protein